MFKIITWNVNGIRAAYEKTLMQFKNEFNPDVLCLQETKAHRDQVEKELVTLGYKQSFWSSAIRKGYSGVATFSNSEILDQYNSIGMGDYHTEGRIVWTRHEHFDLYNMYFPNGSSGPERHLYKQKFLKDLSMHLYFERKRGRKIILVGDYNVAHQEIDVYDPNGLSKESGFLPEERQWFTDFLKLGFVDLFRHFHGNKKDVYSWWSYKDQARMKNNGWRIDYICVSEDLLPYAKECEVLMAQTGSDHCPVLASFDFKAP